VLLWNAAATAITGYLSAEMLSRGLHADFYQIEPHHHADLEHGIVRRQADVTERPVLVSLRHGGGHRLPAMLRCNPLRDALGARFGTLLRFHPVEEIDALPHGTSNDDGAQEKQVEQSQEEMEDRLDEAWQEWRANAIPFGLLWIQIDQAAMLRKTHGCDAAEAMMKIVERTLLHGLKPTEMMVLWGVNEFLVLCHERTEQMLEAHAQHLCGLVRTADFRWWGDRVELTASVGAAQAEELHPERESSLSSLLKRAQDGMQESMHAGGNHVLLKFGSR
jgi:diguanylate cyclase (GGDEF)-like protein